MEGPAATVTAAAATAAEAVNSNGMGKESAAPPAAASAGQQQQDEKGARSAQAVVEGLEGQHTQPAGQHEEVRCCACPEQC
jgi:hypothetical protein